MIYEWSESEWSESGDIVGIRNWPDGPRLEQHEVLRRVAAAFRRIAAALAVGRPVSGRRIKPPRKSSVWRVEGYSPETPRSATASLASGQVGF